MKPEHPFGLVYTAVLRIGDSGALSPRFVGSLCRGGARSSRYVQVQEDEDEDVLSSTRASTDKRASANVRGIASATHLAEHRYDAR
jgi:hypothetical protein